MFASIKRGLLASLTLFGLAAPLSASASIVFSFSGVCQVSCARFGLADGTAFTETSALKLDDGTNTSAGATLLLSSIQSFTLFGLDFLTGNTFAPAPTWVADNVLGGFILGSGSNQFCYNVPLSTCAGGRWDTTVGSPVIATGGSGHGTASFALAGTVPEPGSAALVAAAMAGLLVFRRSSGAVRSTTASSAR